MLSSFCKDIVISKQFLKIKSFYIGRQYIRAEDMLRSLYKVVPTKNIPTIIKSGLKPSRDGIEGVFMLSIKDLKYWNQCQVVNDKKRIPNLLQALIDQVIFHGQTYDLSLLKINMKELDIRKFRIREEQMLLNDSHARNTFMQKLNINNKTLRGFFKYFIQRNKYYRQGESLNRAKIHTNNKKAIEYIYPDIIPSEAIEIVGNCDNVKGKSLAYIFTDLTKGKPEANNVFSQLM